MSKSNKLGIGLAGFGTVGSGVWNTLEKNGDLISDRTGSGVSLGVTKILVRDLKKTRATRSAVPREMLTTDWHELVNDPAVDIVVELIGGTTDAFEIVAAALLAKKPVVTGNKALLAERGVELFAISRKMETPIFFEAAIAGGIPIVKTVQDSFVGNQIHSFTGIINGTSNYILQQMTLRGIDYPAALQEAQDLGYAEADPALDVNGWDAAHKAILLATLAYGFPIDPGKVYVTGIEQARPTDIAFAKSLGYVIKLLAIVRERECGSVELRVQPSFISKNHILAAVNGVFNAVAVNADAAGESLFYGAGAGQGPPPPPWWPTSSKPPGWSPPAPATEDSSPTGKQADSSPSRTPPPPTTSVSTSLTRSALSPKSPPPSPTTRSASPAPTPPWIPPIPTPTSSTWSSSSTPAPSEN